MSLYGFDKYHHNLYNIIMETAVKNKTLKIFTLIANAMLFFAICLYAAQPIIMLFLKGVIQAKFSLHNLFVWASILSAVGVIFKMLVVFFGEVDVENISRQRVIKAVKGKWELIFLLLAFIWTFISCCVAQKQAIVWTGNSYNVEGFEAVCMYGVIFIAAYLLDSSKLKKAFCITLVLSAAIMGIILLYVHLDGAQFLFHPTRSIYRNSNHYGYALSVSCVLAAGMFVEEKKIWIKVLYGVGFAILHANMLISDCLGSFLGEIIAIVCLFVLKLFMRRDKNLLICFLVVMFLLLSVTLALELSGTTSVVIEVFKATGETGDIISGGGDGAEGSGRWGLWVKTIEVIKQVPLFGKGLDCYYGNNYVDKTLDMPHNEYIQIASNVGLPALILYLIVGIGIFSRAIARRKELSSSSLVCLIAAVGYLISALFGNTFTYTYPFLLILLGLGMFKNPKESDNGN